MEKIASDIFPDKQPEIKKLGKTFSTEMKSISKIATAFFKKYTHESTTDLKKDKTFQKQLNEIIKVSEAVTNGDKSKRVKLNSTPLSDMKMVSSAFNEMLDSLQSATDELQNWSHQLEYKVQRKSEELSEMQNELIHVERIASLGKLSSSVAHEINNPLSGVLTYTKLVHKQLSRASLDKGEKLSMLKYLKVIEDETKRCGDIVKGLLDFSRKDQLDFKMNHLHKVLREAFALMGFFRKLEPKRYGNGKKEKNQK